MTMTIPVSDMFWGLPAPGSFWSYLKGLIVFPQWHRLYYFFVFMAYDW